ncbi:hypothetical protein DFH08DRAFT_974980 [Mycena albidolilacea]|uniref:Uncharacterized protein n=1 Tax=Mycena albidolilacea TaxID=1033008 RepID=A0AAD7EB59_9AGAR|nr:hypothetical protein DFH08DRAFT_974980 [Mycena albidolilacea]
MNFPPAGILLASRASSFDLLSAGGGGAGLDDANVPYECVVHMLSDCRRTMGALIFFDAAFPPSVLGLGCRAPKASQKSFFLAARLLRPPIS